MKDTISAIAKIIDQAEKFRNAYFWSAPGCAARTRKATQFPPSNGRKADTPTARPTKSLAHAKTYMHAASTIETANVRR